MSLRSAEDFEVEMGRTHGVRKVRKLSGQRSHGDEARSGSTDTASAKDEYSKRLRLGIVRPQILSWSPKVMLLENFLSSSECDHLVSLAKGNLEPSTVVDTETGNSVPDEWRNSSNYFLSSEEETEDATVVEIIERISVYTQTPVESMEPFQILRYKNGQFYNAHEDYIYGPANDGSGSRTKTVLLYLTDGVVGGETWFLNAPGNCTCGGRFENGLSVRPKKGRAVVFWDMTWEGKSDEASLHAGCRVLSGVKWSATKWLLNAPFDQSNCSAEESPKQGEKEEGEGEGEKEEEEEPLAEDPPQAEAGAEVDRQLSH